MSVSPNRTDGRKPTQADKDSINQLYYESLGYIPRRMKPVHFATSFLLCLHKRYRELELLNKAANPKSAAKTPEDEYVAENLVERLVNAPSPRLESDISLADFKLLRNHLNAIYNNDGAALAAYFPPYSTFGCDYSAPSLEYLTNQSKNSGNAGAFTWLVLNASITGKKFLELSLELAKATASSPAAVLGKPLIDFEDTELATEILEIYGNPSEELIPRASKLMIRQTEALGKLAKNLQSFPSPYSLRNLIIGIGSWLMVYWMQRIVDAEDIVFFSDFAGESCPRLRAQAKACYARQIGLFGRSIRLWLQSDINSNLRDTLDVYEKFEGLISKELEDHFRDFSERIGWVQPRTGTRQKFFRIVPDTMRVLLMSVLEPEGVYPMDQVAYLLKTHWNLVLGLVPEDHSILREHGYAALDEDEDLRANREAFKDLAIRLGLAWEPSDGLVLFSLTPEYIV